MKHEHRCDSIESFEKHGDTVLIRLEARFQQSGEMELNWIEYINGRTTVRGLKKCPHCYNDLLTSFNQVTIE